MKEATIDTPAAFPDEKVAPTTEDVVAMVGQAAFAAFSKLRNWVDTSHKNASHEWLYSTTVGWYEMPSVGDRRLYCFIPRRGDFTLNIVLGEKAIHSLSTNPYAKRISSLVKHSKHYAEGTLLSFDSQTFDPDVAIALLRAKLAH